MRQEKNIHQLKSVLRCADPFGLKNEHNKLLNVNSKEIFSKSIEENILSTEKQGVDAFTTFVDERITGTHKNLCDKMTKLKRHNWTDGKKSLNVNNGGKEVVVKAANTLFSRLLIVARSSREEVDLKEAIGVYGFSMTNQMLMTADGRLHPSKDKSQVDFIHLRTSLSCESP